MRIGSTIKSAIKAKRNISEKEFDWWGGFGGNADEESFGVSDD